MPPFAQLKVYGFAHVWCEIWSRWPLAQKAFFSCAWLINIYRERFDLQSSDLAMRFVITGRQPPFNIEVIRCKAWCPEKCPINNLRTLGPTVFKLGRLDCYD